MASLLMTSRWLGPQLAAAMARATKWDGLYASLSSCLCHQQAVRTLGQQSAIACMSRRDLHRWPETLPGLVTPFPLKQTQRRTVLPWINTRLRQKLYGPGCHVLVAYRWVTSGLVGDPPPAASRPHPPSPQAEGWPNALNHKSSNFTCFLTSQRVSGTTVLCSPS